MNFLSGSAAVETLLHRRRLPTFMLHSKVCFMFKGRPAARRPDHEYKTGNGETSQQTALGLFQVQMRR